MQQINTRVKRIAKLNVNAITKVSFPAKLYVAIYQFPWNT